MYFLLIDFNTNLKTKFFLQFRFDKYLRILELSVSKSPASQTPETTPYQTIALNEMKSQFYYSCSLILTKLNPDDIKINDKSIELKLNLSKLTPNFLMAVSSLISKPNSPHFTWSAKKIEHKKRTNKMGSSSTVDDLIELLHNDSNWRYSIIGNWFKFVANSFYGSDSVEFMKELYHTRAKINVSINFITYRIIIFRLNLINLDKTIRLG